MSSGAFLLNGTIGQPVQDGDETGLVVQEASPGLLTYASAIHGTGFTYAGNDYAAVAALVGDVGVHHLDGDVPLEDGVESLEDRPHPPPAEEGDHLVLADPLGGHRPHGLTDGPGLGGVVDHLVTRDAAVVMKNLTRAYEVQPQVSPSRVAVTLRESELERFGSGESLQIDVSAEIVARVGFTSRSYSMYRIRISSE